MVLLMLWQIGASQQSVEGQQPEQKTKQANTQPDEKHKPTPEHQTQTIVIQAKLESESQRQNEKANTEAPTKTTHDWIDKLNAFSTLIIALFTIGMVVVIGIQIREYRIRERAWVTYLSPEFIQKTKGGQPDGYRIVGFIKNVGNTPATVVKKFHFQSTVMKGASLNLTPPYLQIEESQTEYLMVPEATEPAIAEIPESEVLNIHQLTMYVLGQVVYKDVFGRLHETRYCLRYYPTTTADRQSGFYPEGPPAYLRVT
jgi:hypothetical protein